MIKPTSLVFILTCVQFIRLHNDAMDSRGAADQFRLFDSCELFERLILRITPSTQSYPAVRVPKVLPGEVNRRRCLDRRLPCEHADALQHAIADEVAHVVDVVVGGELHLSTRRQTDAEKASEELVGGGDGEVVLECVDDLQLHLLHVLLGVYVVRELQDHADLGVVDLLVLGGDQIRSHTHQLVVRPRHHVLLLSNRRCHVPVDDIDTQIERLSTVSEVTVHIHNPVDQRFAHITLYISLPVQVVREAAKFVLRLQPGVDNALGVRRKV